MTVRLFRRPLRSTWLIVWFVAAVAWFGWWVAVPMIAAMVDVEVK